MACRDGRFSRAMADVLTGDGRVHHTHTWAFETASALEIEAHVCASDRPGVRENGV